MEHRAFLPNTPLTEKTNGVKVPRSMFINSCYIILLLFFFMSQ